MTNDEKIDALQSRIAASRDVCFDEDERQRWDWLEEFRALLAERAKPDPCPDIKGYVSGGGMEHVMSKVRAGVVTPAMVEAGAKAAREYMERTGGNDPAVIYRAMRAAAPPAPAAEKRRDLPEDLFIFVNAAAGEGFELDGVDAADLCVRLFPERFGITPADAKEGGQ